MTTAPRSERGFTLPELLIALAIIGVLSAIAIPGLLRARMSGNETSAIGSLRAINSAESSYLSSCANGYAQNLADLAKPPKGSSNGFISPDLSANGVIKSGYVVVLSKDAGATTVMVAAKTCNAADDDTVSGYFAETHPAGVGSTGGRAFGTDSRATIYYNDTGTPVVPGMSGSAPIY